MTTILARKHPEDVLACRETFIPVPKYQSETTDFLSKMYEIFGKHPSLRRPNFCMATYRYAITRQDHIVAYETLANYRSPKPIESD